ncbi:glycosidase [Cytobacillus oceanisediminis]|uniref:Glycosidase n=1 Tax=Cytobacillus oceanisediminis TaxID=665099 RepID=A0A2V3AC49_9BACI|nr:alpha-amylase family glycosyl hydrolase [Cytobacillus oceanisediminis]PWW31104.1 glycosidase [Cytobacillus oceanisediminis]
MKQARKAGIWIMLLSLIFSLFTGMNPQLSSANTIQSPVVDGNSAAFSYQGEAQQVRIAGSFTDWKNKAIEMTKGENNIWSKTINLSPGVYEYKFILDDSNWITDPANSRTANGNSLLVVSGLTTEMPVDIEKGSTVNLSANLLNGDGTTEDVQPAWSLVEETEGITLTDNQLIISDIAAAGSVTVIGEYNGYTLEHKFQIAAQMNTYTINYHRNDGEQLNWDLWAWETGKDGGAYPFTSQTEGFAQAVLTFTSNEINVIPRPGSWDTQDVTRTITMPEGQNEVEVWLEQGDETVYYSKEDFDNSSTEDNRRFIEFTYVRNDHDYEGWNIWTWQTGVNDGQADFTEVTDKGAVALIEIGQQTEQMGFVIRKGTGWNQKDPYGADRYIKTGNDSYTKVVVTSGQGEFYQVPPITGPVLNNGSLTLYYRDPELFKQGDMDSIEKVQAKLDGQLYEMTYSPMEERFFTTIDQLEEGTYEYSFLVTKNGETSEAADPFNSVDGKSSITYKNPSAEIIAEVKPWKATYNENAVLSVETILSDSEVAIKEVYADLSAIGGSSKVSIDPALSAQTISIDQSVTAGQKQLPITVVDEYGNLHEGEASIEVATRTFNGKKDDFDWDEARIYFMLTDRFNNGDASNDDPNGAKYDTSHLETYHGGDFRGVIEKLDYLEDLGINTIWITPIVDNINWDLRYDKDGNQYGYHGYWAKDFSTLDEHLGDIQTFQELLEKAHDRGIKVMVDVVLNHTGYGLKENDPSIGLGIPNFPTDADRERFAGMIRDGGTDTIRGELAGLPDLKTEEEAVRRQIIEWQTAWLEKAKTNRGDTIDYFRVDTVKHVEHTTWKAFKNALTEIKPDFKMIGEYYGGYADEHGGFLDSGEMDSILDFDFKHTAADFINGHIDAAEEKLQARNGKLTNTATLGQFLSSHDEDGFLITSAGKDWGKMKIASALQITAKGQPVIYYGEEIGLSGKHAGDMDKGEFNENRYDFDWSLIGNDMHEHYRKLLNIRKNYSDVFSKGTREKLAGSDADGYLFFNRSYSGTHAVVGLNTKLEQKKATINVPFSAGSKVIDQYSGKKYNVDKNNQIKVKLPGRNDGGTVILVQDEKKQK